MGCDILTNHSCLNLLDLFTELRNLKDKLDSIDYESIIDNIWLRIINPENLDLSPIYGNPFPDEGYRNFKDILTLLEGIRTDLDNSILNIENISEQINGDNSDIDWDETIDGVTSIVGVIKQLKTVLDALNNDAVKDIYINGKKVTFDYQGKKIANILSLNKVEATIDGKDQEVSVTEENLEPQSLPYVNTDIEEVPFVGKTLKFNFGNLKGKDGKGIENIEISNVESGILVTITYTDNSDPTEFVIPRGQQGLQGIPGQKGATGIYPVEDGEVSELPIFTMETTIGLSETSSMTLKAITDLLLNKIVETKDFEYDVSSNAGKAEYITPDIKALYNSLYSDNLTDILFKLGDKKFLNSYLTMYKDIDNKIYLIKTLDNNTEGWTLNKKLSGIKINIENYRGKYINIVPRKKLRHIEGNTYELINEYRNICFCFSNKVIKYDDLSYSYDNTNKSVSDITNSIIGDLIITDEPISVKIPENAVELHIIRSKVTPKPDGYEYLNDASYIVYADIRSSDKYYFNNFHSVGDYNMEPKSIGIYESKFDILQEEIENLQNTLYITEDDLNEFVTRSELNNIKDQVYISNINIIFTGNLNVGHSSGETVSGRSAVHEIDVNTYYGITSGGTNGGCFEITNYKNHKIKIYKGTYSGFDKYIFAKNTQIDNNSDWKFSDYDFENVEFDSNGEFVIDVPNVEGNIYLLIYKSGSSSYKEYFDYFEVYDEEIINFDNLTTYKLYVSSNGNDENDGLTMSSPLATISKAIEKSGPNTTIIISGDFNESINLSGKNNLNIVGYSNTVNGELKRNRIICGENITFNKYTGDFSEFESLSELETDNLLNSLYVYNDSNNLFNISNDIINYKWIYIHDKPNLTTEILVKDAHPLYKGKKYRCDHQKLFWVKELEDLLNPYTFWYNSETHNLYANFGEYNNENSYSIKIPSNGAIAINLENSNNIKLSNIEALYGKISLNNANNIELTDCSAKCITGGGAFTWDYGINIKLIRCEAYNVIALGDSTGGDGFNAHTEGNYDFREKICETGTLIDCWAHDIRDDGFSDHYRSDTTIIGGLFEYCGKGGITPSFGSQVTIKNAECRYNRNFGLTYTGSSYLNNNPNPKYGSYFPSAICMNCYSHDNGISNFDVQGGNENFPNCLITIGCHSARAGRELTNYEKLEYYYSNNSNYNKKRGYGYSASGGSGNYLKIIKCTDNDSILGFDYNSNIIESDEITEYINGNTELINDISLNSHITGENNNKYVYISVNGKVVSGNSAAGSPYYISAPIPLNSGETLVIENGIASAKAALLSECNSNFDVENNNTIINTLIGNANTTLSYTANKNMCVVVCSNRQDVILYKRQLGLKDTLDLSKLDEALSILNEGWETINVELYSIPNPNVENNYLYLNRKALKFVNTDNEIKFTTPIYFNKNDLIKVNCACYKEMSLLTKCPDEQRIIDPQPDDILSNALNILVGSGTSTGTKDYEYEITESGYYFFQCYATQGFTLYRYKDSIINELEKTKDKVNLLEDEFNKIRPKFIEGPSLVRMFDSYGVIGASFESPTIDGWAGFRDGTDSTSGSDYGYEWPTLLGKINGVKIYNYSRAGHSLALWLKKVNDGHSLNDTKWNYLPIVLKLNNIYKLREGIPIPECFIINMSTNDTGGGTKMLGFPLSETELIDENNIATDILEIDNSLTSEELNKNNLNLLLTNSEELVDVNESHISDGNGLPDFVYNNYIGLLLRAIKLCRIMNPCCYIYLANHRRSAKCPADESGPRTIRVKNFNTVMKAVCDYCYNKYKRIYLLDVWNDGFDWEKDAHELDRGNRGLYLFGGHPTRLGHITLANQFNTLLNNSIEKNMDEVKDSQFIQFGHMPDGSETPGQTDGSEEDNG